MSALRVAEDADLNAVHRLAEFLALTLKPGDVVALRGDLGAGKTTFARAVIRAVLGDETREVPSPTFSLVQGYGNGRLPLAHVDCYRMSSADELQEIGLDEALREGAALIEWPERIEEALPGDRLDISFADGPREGTRKLTLTGHGSWRERADRLQAMMNFCTASSWAAARPVFLQGDASTRAYARLHRGGETAILMDSPSRTDGTPVKDGKPYSQLVHLAEDVRPFVAVAEALKDAGVSVPEIIAHDLAQGFLITGDLGDGVFATQKEKDAPLEELYRTATDVLVHLKGRPPADKLPLPGGGGHSVPAFDQQVFETEAGLLIDWFYPAVHGREASSEVRGTFLSVLGVLHESIAGQDEGWALRDYHSPNLLWLPEREGIRRVGIIDFQDALKGHAAYDLVSLLQDARRDISPALEGRLYAHYCEARSAADSGFDAPGFTAAYAVLGAQRNSKILGIFARLAKRDGKHVYLAHIPRVSGYLERNLVHPALAEMRAWFAEYLPADLRAGKLAI